MAHDLVIEHARIIDGLGTPGRDGSLAVKDGRIAAISGDASGGELGAAAQRIDAGGLALAPGIVDIHTHYDAQLTWDPFATPSSSLGVTTVVIGNCGFTIAPCRPAHRDIIVRNLTHVEGMSLEAMQAGINWDFETYPEYLASLERRGMVPNVASLRRPLLRAHLGARRPGQQARGHRGGDRRDAAHRARGDAHRRHRLRHLDPRAAQWRERRAHALAPGRRARDARADRRPRRGRARRVHADQGHDVHRALAREDRRGERPARDDRRDVRRPRRPDPRVQGARRDRGGPRARARALGPGRLLPARHGVHPAPSLSARGLHGLAPRHRGRGRGALSRGPRRPLVPRGAQGRDRPARSAAIASATRTGIT